MTVVGGRRSWLYVLKVAVGGAVHSVQVRGTVVGGRGTKYKIDGWGPGPVGRSVGWMDGGWLSVSGRGRGAASGGCVCVMKREGHTDSRARLKFRRL